MAQNNSDKSFNPNEGQSSRPGYAYSPFSFPFQYCNHLERQEFAPQFGYRSIPMMAPQFSSSAPMMAIPPQSSNPPVQSTTENSSGAQKKKNRWSDTEEKILIELFGENEERLSYKSYNSPEWESIARQLRERCRRENVACDKSAQQCKKKMANLTKKYKNVKDKLRSTGNGRGGGNEPDQETPAEKNDEVDIVPKNYKDVDEILGNREAVNPRHVLEGSVPEVESAIDRDILEKEALDEEILSAAERRPNRTGPRQEDVTPGPSGECSAGSFNESDEDESYLTASDLAKNRKRTSTPKAEKAVAKKNSKKKARGSGTEESTVLSFLERALERDEAFMEWMAEAERQSRREQHKFS